MEVLKRLDNVFEPDARQGLWVTFDEKLKDYRPRRLEDHYRSVEKVTLQKNIPEEVVSSFETARNLLLYSWFVYHFATIAQLQTFASLELALKKKRDLEGCSKKIKGLKALLRLAIKNEWIDDSEIRHHQRLEEQRKEMEESIKGARVGRESTDVEEEVKEYCGILMETFPPLRNDLAHGSGAVLMPGQAYLALEISADLINQLFK